MRQKDQNTTGIKGYWTLYPHKDAYQVGDVKKLRLADYSSLDEIKDLAVKEGHNALAVHEGKEVWVKDIPSAMGVGDFIDSETSEIWVYTVRF